MALGTNAATLTATCNAMTTLNGADGPEAQIEWLMQLALHAAEVGFRPDSARFVALFTDAPYHVAGDAVVSLTDNSSNIVTAITAGLTAATTTHIEDACGRAGDDDIIGSTDDNSLTGNAGNDTLSGRAGHDVLIGGAGADTLDDGSGDDTMIGGADSDTARFTGARADYTVVIVPGGLVITELRTGVTDGVDTVSGMDLFSFSDGTIAYAQLLGIAGPLLTSIADTDAGLNTVAENSSAGTVVGVDLEGQDAGGGAMPASFALVKDATGATLSLAGPLQINAATGVVTVRDETLLNFEAATSQTIFVRTIGADGTTIITTHVIAISDVFEPISILQTLTKLADIFVAPTDDHYSVVGLAGNDVITTAGGNDLIVVARAMTRSTPVTARM